MLQKLTPFSPKRPRGPYTIEGAGGEVYNTIMSVAISPRNSNIIYAGTDDGLVNITIDGGNSWNSIYSGVGEDLRSVSMVHSKNGIK